LMIVISIIGILATFAIPQYAIYLETAHATACLVERSQANRLIIAYSSEHPETSLTSLSQLVSGGYADKVPACPYGGVWVLIPPTQGSGLPTVGCSLHYWPGGDTDGSDGTAPETGTGEAAGATPPAPEPEAPEQQTSLGSGFSEISGALIDLIEAFHDENGSYPRSWGDFAFSDIGLDPAEWENPVEGIVYSPAGKRLGISPEDGYEFIVTSATGEELTLTSDRNWSLWYSMEDGNWYFHNINDRNLIDISILVVVPE